MFERKRTPVWGVRKYRGGGYGWHRRIRTFQERRLNQEGGARAKRMGKNLPDSWDDLNRCFHHGWKIQGKRRKQWAR